MYRQIVGQIRELVASGGLAPGDMLPSVRAVATELGINPMTVSKAYSLLDQAGFLSRRRGIGMVVARNATDPMLAIEPEARSLVASAKEVGVSRSGLLAQIRRIWEET